MEKKGKQKRPAQFKRPAVDDIMNINEGASKKRKKSVSPHLRPAVLKTLKLKPDPTLLFSQFKPKGNQVNETTTSGCSSVAGKYSSQPSNSAKESSKVGFSKGWTPPLKSAAWQRKKSAIPSSSFQKIGVFKECNKVREVEFSNISEKPKLDFETNMIDSVNSNTQMQNISYGFDGKNDADIDRNALNDGSQSSREVIYLEKVQDTADTSGNNPYRNQTGIDTLLEAIDVIEANTEYNIKMENSNANYSKHEADEIGGVGEQKFFNEDGSEENPITETNSNDLSIFDPTPNGKGHVSHGEVIVYQKKESFEFNTQPIEPLTDKNSSRNDLPIELIDLTNESYEVGSISLEKTVEEPVEMKTAIDGSGNVPVTVDEYHDNSLTSDSVKYRETVIVNFTSPVVCTVINKARNSSEVLKVLGGENENSNLDQEDSVEETPVDDRDEGEKDMTDSDDEGEGDRIYGSAIEENTDAEDEKIMKEVRTYVYDSLTSSQKQYENWNFMEYGNETVSPNHLIKSQKDENSNLIDYGNETVVSQNMKSQNYENTVVTNADQAVSYDFGYVEETEIDCKVAENKEDNEVKENYERTSVDGVDGSDSYQQNTKKDDDEADSYQQITSKEDDYQDARDERIEEKKESIMNEEQRDEETPTPEHMSSETKACEENEDIQLDENKDASNSSVENVKDELLYEDDDAFDMSCTQLIHIENEYSNKTNENVGANVEKTAALQNKPIDLNVGNVQVPSVSENNNARPIPDLSLQWVDRRAEERQKLRAVIQELSQLNARITQFRQILWPKMK